VFSLPSNELIECSIRIGGTIIVLDMRQSLRRAFQNGGYAAFF
jgi:hypothetical protein